MRLLVVCGLCVVAVIVMAGKIPVQDDILKASTFTQSKFEYEATPVTDTAEPIVDTTSKPATSEKNNGAVTSTVQPRKDTPTQVVNGDLEKETSDVLADASKTAKAQPCTQKNNFSTIEEAQEHFEDEADGARQGYDIVISPDVAEEHQIELWLVDGAYRKTADGLTYGSLGLEDAVGEPPDLVSVLGVNGNRGFCRLEDYDPMRNVKTLEDAEEYNRIYGQVENRTVPVYDLNGNMIDEFIFEDGKALA